MEGAISSEPNMRIAVVTGGNKGIGLEVCRQLAGHGVTVVLTARDEMRGAEAVEKLRALGLADVVFHQLDITDASSIATLVDFLKTRFGKLDILVNNAAIGGVEYLQEVDGSQQKGSVAAGGEHTPESNETSMHAEPEEASEGDAAYDPEHNHLEPPQGESSLFAGTDYDQMLEWIAKNVREPIDGAKKGVQTNYYGTKHVTEALLPLLQSSSDGRIVNVSSVFGLLRLISSEEVRQELNDIDNLTEERLDELLNKFFKDFEADALEAHGWPTWYAAYKVAKIAMNAYSRMLARRHPALCVNCVHPGYVKTDMSMNSGVLTPEEGARNVVKVALLPDGGPTGKYFAEGEEASFV